MQLYYTLIYSILLYSLLCPTLPYSTLLCPPLPSSLPQVLGDVTVDPLEMRSGDSFRSLSSYSQSRDKLLKKQLQQEKSKTHAADRVRTNLSSPCHIGKPGGGGTFITNTALLVPGPFTLPLESHKFGMSPFTHKITSCFCCFAAKKRSTQEVHSTAVRWRRT